MPTLAAVALLLLPGAAVGFVARLRGLMLLGLAGPISIAVLGASAVVAPLVGVGFSPLVLVAGTLAAVSIAFAVRRVGPFATGAGRGSRRDLLVVLAAVIAAAASALIAFGSVSSPDLPSQTYDGVFHVNAVAWILDNGDASSFHLYRMTHPGEDIEFYPAAWHALVALVVQLSGVSVAVATDAVWIAVNGAVLSLGSALFAVVLLRPARRSTTLVGVTAALSATVTAAAPYVLLRWGVLYPSGLAYALLPAGLALSVIAVRAFRTRRLWPAAALLAVWAAASAFAHPRSLVSYALLVAPLLIGGVVGWARTGIASPDTRRRTVLQVSLLAGAAVLAAAGGAFAVLRYFGTGDRPISDRLNGGPATARQTIGESLRQVLALAPPSGPGETPLPVTVVIAAAVLSGLLIALFRRELRWVAVAYLLVGALYVLAAGSNADFAKIATGFWYKDKYRLFALLGVLAPPLLALLALRAAELGRRARSASLGGAVRRLIAPAIAPALVLVVIVAGWAGPTLAAMREVLPLDFEVGDQKAGRLLDRGEFELLTELPSLVEEDAVIVGNPWNGSTLSYSLGRRESLFPHLTGDWDPDRLTVAQRLDSAAVDPEVCAALDRLGAHYLFASDGLLWNGDPQAVQYEAVDRAAGAAGFELIAQEGTSRLYRITACD
jgi:hypothetical protein